MTTHTPGPWTCDVTDFGGSNTNSFYVLIDANSHSVARVLTHSRPYEANAAIIAAAPDMLAMLKSAALWIEATAEMTGDAEAAKYLTKLQATIAKAEGEKS